jgi:hypothetical protein
MRYISTLSLCFLLIGGHAYAATSDAREIARINNCPPKKIEVYQQSLAAAQTIYRVTCNMPKATDPQTGTVPDALLIQCEGSLCEMLRPVSVESK